jgi:hypothetical protein
MATTNFDTYDQIGQAEDVQDAIYRISPVDAPVVSMSKTIRATAKIHEWHQHALSAANTNKLVEGADAPADSSTAVVNKSNFCQIMSKVAEIAGTLEAVDKYGRDSEMAFQLERIYGELANDEEFAVVGSQQAGAAGDSSTAREMKSFVPQLAAGVVSNETTTTTVAGLEDNLVATHQACYDLGGNPGYLVVSPSRSLHISDFARASGRNRDIRNEKTVVNVVDLYVSNFGELDVVIDRNIEAGTMIGFDPEYAATAVLRPTTDWELAKVGDSMRRQVLREGTYAVLNDGAHFAMTNVPASLT